MNYLRNYLTITNRQQREWTNMIEDNKNTRGRSIQRMQMRMRVIQKTAFTERAREHLCRKTGCTRNDHQGRSTDLTTVVVMFVKAVAVNVAQVCVRHVYVNRQVRRGERRSAVLRAKHCIAPGAGRPYGHQAWFLRGSVQSCNIKMMNEKA